MMSMVKTTKSGGKVMKKLTVKKAPPVWHVWNV